MLIHITNINAWKCGIGPISGAISYVVAIPGNLVGVNRCCVEHDDLIDKMHIDRKEADRVFCQCLSDNGSW
ncbi:hypothetical protein DICVIV_10279 [Dictyocaulus viviparus]|uniref:Uncharacterized protein n=1 Tax=Dictyocaulus viviparus TaxID=29172 RepID=A0A0D8XGC4_DICVI|nr:hypothetical protein DICVIV_10279 [Dictyocaulus viviparus]